MKLIFKQAKNFSEIDWLLKQFFEEKNPVKDRVVKADAQIKWSLKQFFEEKNPVKDRVVKADVRIK